MPQRLTAQQEMTQQWRADPAELERWFATLARTIAVDFDGVIHPYTAGWQGSTPADELPMTGARDFLRYLQHNDFVAVVFSTRADHEEGLAGILAYLVEHDLMQYVNRVTHEKPAAIAYVDDRAVPFHGDWMEVIEGVEELARGPIRGASHGA